MTLKPLPCLACTLEEVLLAERIRDKNESMSFCDSTTIRRNRAALPKKLRGHRRRNPWSILIALFPKDLLVCFRTDIALSEERPDAVSVAQFNQLIHMRHERFRLPQSVRHVDHHTKAPPGLFYEGYAPVRPPCIIIRAKYFFGSPGHPNPAETKRFWGVGCSGSVQDIQFPESGCPG